MACEILVRGSYNNNPHELGGHVGDIVVIRDLPHNGWGSKESPPNYVVIRITDSSRAELKKYLGSYVQKIDINVTESPSKKNLVLEFMNTNTSTSGKGKLKDADLDYFLEFSDGQRTAYNDGLIVAQLNLNKMRKSEWWKSSKDKSEDIGNIKRQIKLAVAPKYIRKHKHRIDESVIDNFIHLGGFLEMTKQQFEDIILDKELE